LTEAEQGKALYLLNYRSRVCAFYATELVYNLIQRNDPHLQLYGYYQQLIKQLSSNEKRELALRFFEKQLLRELGYALVLDREIESQDLIEPDLMYQYILEKGPVLYQAQLHQEPSFNDAYFSPLLVSGIVLNSIERDLYADDGVMKQAKRFMRYIIKVILDRKNLHSRDMLYLSSQHSSQY